MPNGNLASHIFEEVQGSNQVLFGWRQRYKAIIELASALKYLHQDSSHTSIVHQDVKVSNVLVDSEWNARLGACGMAHLLKDGDHPWHGVAGSVGYIAPESFLPGIVSTASDVYSFGISVLEIACGRRRYIRGFTHSDLRQWVWELYQSGDLMKASDVRLGGDVNEDEMKRLLLLGLSCTNVDPHTRPTIEEVLRILSGSELSELPL
eukprot:c25127_g1_i4 orf=354-974(+)